MANSRKSINFLPKAFQTLGNQRFLNATVDPLIQEPQLKKMYGYIGQQDQSPVYNTSDYYINENDSYSQFYQLEPGVVINKRQLGTNTYKVNNVYNYIDILNQISSDGGLNNNHDRLFTNRYYSYNGFIDLDKLTNYRQYYWVPGGPLTVDVTANNTNTVNDFYIHRNSYITNNETELQSASLGQTGFAVDGYNNTVNPTITLDRGGSYNFHVNQSTNFWIQTETGVSGTSTVQNNISTRDVLGVSNNGSGSGTITFTVPLRTAQDYLINYPTISQNVDIIVDNITYDQMQGVNYDNFILQYALDGVRAFDGKFIVFTSLTGFTDVDATQYHGVWQVNVQSDRTMHLTYIADWANLSKVFVSQGDVYGHVFVYKDQLGTITKFPTLSAAQDVLYYCDGSNPLVYGTIQLVDPTPNSLLNVNDIIGRDYYTSPNGVQFTSGLKVKFTGLVVPNEYLNNEYIVEGVGSSIKLIKYNELVTPEIINTNLGSSFGNSRGYDASGTGYDGTSNSPEEKDYITINRASVDGNSWSRNNRWFHRDVLQAAANYNNVSYSFDATSQAKRPIVEFLPNLKLFNYGTNYRGSITCADSTTTSPLSQVEGLNSYAIKTNNVYNSDGIQLLNDVTVLFKNASDPTIRSTLYRVQNNKTRASATYSYNTYSFSASGSKTLYINNLGSLAIGQHVTGVGIPQNTTIVSIDTVNVNVTISNAITSDIPSGNNINFDNSYDQVHLVPIKSFVDGDTIIVMEGLVDQGNMYYYYNNYWHLAQVRNSRPQFPLFDIIDSNGISLSNTTNYPSSNFAGNQLFGYKIGSGTRDSELGFALTYKSIGNLGDIVFENFYETDTFDYNLNQVDQVRNINSGYAAVISSWNNYSFANGWYRVSDKSKQYIAQSFTTTAVSINNFDLKTVYSNSFYETNLFVYVNGILQPITNYKLTTNNTTSVLVFNNDLAVGDRVFVKIYGTTQNYNTTYTMPKNLTNNSENTEFSTITLGQLRNHLIEIGENLLNLSGEPAGANNFRDLNFNYVGGKLLQHSASLRPAALLFANQDVDPIQILRYATDSYVNFKNQLMSYINNTQFTDTTNYSACLDLVLKNFTDLANSGAPFYYTDMIASGSNYTSNSYTVSNTNYRRYNLIYNLNDDIKGYRSLLVYLNGVLLLKNIDYTIESTVVAISKNVTLNRNDVITIVEYESTLGCNVPATPTKLGIYPKFEPQIVTDNTYITPTITVVGHDGSISVGYGDYRDNILLEFEKRVFNNITTTYADDSDVDLSATVPGAFRKTDYTITEWTQLLAPEFLRWSNSNSVDIFTNNTANENRFTWNYSSGVDNLFYSSVPGNWRAIYKYFYDTDRPHTNPWEMLGFTFKPSWWDLRYGPAPYSSANNVLWGDLELGFVYGGNPLASYVNPRYTRPGLSKIIPVDEHGNLLSPIQVLVTNYDANNATQNWVVGDQGPAETAWRRSSSYPFAVMIAWCLARPAEWCALKYNTRDLTYNSKLNQFINSTTNNRQFNFAVTDATSYIPGFNVLLRDYLTSNNLDVTENWLNVVANSTFNLVYKMGAFTDKSYLNIVADQVSPQSTNSSVIIPQENYRIAVTKSAPISRAVYSAVIVQKVTNGYQISGFDRERPYFITVPSLVNNNNYGITVGSETAIVYLDSSTGLITYPYGTIFSTQQQVVDFLVSYGRYLESQGFSFNDMLGDNTTKSDWVLAAKEFLFWNQQNWGGDTIISLTPAGININFTTQFGAIDKLTNTNSYTKVIDSDNITLTGRDYRVYRDGNNFTLTLKNTQKGIHLLDLIVVQYEHTIIFDNNTVFNDVLYDEQVGSRQFRLRISGSKTANWDGSLTAPGFFVNVTQVPEWQSYTDYYTGDIVLFKGKYYAAQNFLPGSQFFKSSDWYEINGNLLSKNLIPNMASGAAQFINFHNPDAIDLNSAADALSKSETGFTPRQYFTDLGLDITTQYKFYLGMIAQKGTQSVFNAYLRNQQSRIDSYITLNEQWAIKLDNYGGTSNVDKLEFNIGNSKTINNNYLFEFANSGDASRSDLNTVKPNDLLYVPSTYTPNIFAASEYNPNIIDTAGPVNINDISASVFDINKIFNISSLSPQLYESSKIWIASDNANRWGVYRLSQTNNIAITGVSQVSPSELQFTASGPHYLAQYDYVLLNNGKLIASNSTTNVTDLSGFYRVSAVTNNTFNVRITNNTTVGNGPLNAIVYKLTNIRFTTGVDFSNYVPARGWFNNEIVYIDNGSNGYNVIQNTNNWNYNQLKSPVFTQPSDNFGSSIKINSTQGFALVGSTNKNTTGSAYVYTKRQDNTWQEIGILSPDSRIGGFGANVDINNNNIGFISAPTNLKGMVYVANVNSQQIAARQIIHYDNLYVLSAGFTQSNAYLLVANVTTFDSTANIAASANYSLSNFANGMIVAVPGATTTVTIANISTGYPYNKIGLTANLASQGVSISGGTKIAIYPNVNPSSSFGYSISASKDSNWLFIGEPATNSVYAYKYTNVSPTTTTRIGDGSTTAFTYPAGVPTGLVANDLQVYVNGVLQVPNLDYIRAPGQDVVLFDVAPPLNATITINYTPYYQEANRIITSDANASSFGSSVSTNYDGTVVAVGAPNSTAIFSSTITSSGKTYVFERTSEIFTANGSTNNFSLSNAFANSATITTPYLTSRPTVTVDGVIAAFSMDYVNNIVTLATTPTNGAKVTVATNQFVQTLVANTDAAQQNSSLGTKVVLSADGNRLFSAAVGYGLGNNQNGVIYYYVNTSKKYRTITGSANSFVLSANSSLRINNYLVKFGADTPQVAVQRINSASIPYVTANLLANGSITISDSDMTSKLSLRNEVGDPLGVMGLNQWLSVQRIVNPVSQDIARFGENMSISPDGNTLVVGSTLSNTKTTVTFDNNTTIFDNGGLRYRDTVYKSGAAHIYEYQALASESPSVVGAFAYGTLLNDSNAHSYDRYASGIDINNNFIMVGAPQAYVLNNSTGAMYVYYNKNAQPIWQTIRSDGNDFDSRKVNRVYIYNSTTAKLIADLPVYDLTHGILPDNAEEYIDYVINYDPSVYNVVPTATSFSYNRNSAWGKEKVGKLWWDINSIKYYDNTQGDNLQKFSYYGLAFPGSRVKIYEWIESDVQPKDYVGSNAANTPLYTINDVYTARTDIDEKTGQPVTKYYFWVLNSVLSNSTRPSAYELQNILSSPKNSGQPFAAVVSSNAIGLFNIQDLTSIDTNCVIEYKKDLKSQLVHSEWTLFDDGSDLGVAREFLDKLKDSLGGQDVSGRIVPNPNLPIAQKYGYDVIKRQTFFKDQYTARKLYCENINEVFTQYPIVLTRSDAITFLNDYDPLPTPDQYVKSVANITELGYLDVNYYHNNDQVLVVNDSTNYNSGWSLYKLVVNSTVNTRIWQLVRVQTYDLRNYWSYADWYSPEYNSQFPITHTVNTELDIANLTLNVNDIIYIQTSNNGGWKQVLVTQNNLNLLAQQNATIKLNANLYDLNNSGLGFQTSSFQNVGFDSDNGIEFRKIFDVIKDHILIADFRSNFKDAIKLMINTMATQHQQTDWLMKTSLVDLYHRVRGLDQLPVYLPQPENTVVNFFNEVKPFHTKLKQYIAKYDNSNAVDINYNRITDFDLQPYKNSVTKTYRSPQLGNSLDTSAFTNAVYQPWLTNHTFSVERIDTINGGVGYDASTTVTIVGDGVGATARATILNGSIYTIQMLTNGTSYTYAKVQIYGVGSGASATAILGQSLARSMTTFVKYDRYQYFQNISDWAANTAYAIDSVIVYAAEPYRTVVNHTSTSTFDATKFVPLRVKVWYPLTQYAANDIVVYKNTSYKVTVEFTSGLLFDTNNLTSYNGLWLDNACDRIWAYYAPTSGMVGRDLSQLMTGITYSGNQIIGPNFNQEPGYDVNNYDYIPYDYSTKNVENVIDIFGNQAEDTYIQSFFTDSGLGLRPEDINILGGDFYDAYSSHAPEELIPGQVLDTLDIRVKTLPSINGGPDIKIFTYVYQGNKSIVFDPNVTGVSYPVGGIEKFYVIDANFGPIAEGVDYTVNYQNKTINLNYNPIKGDAIYILMIGSNGKNPVFDIDVVGDGVTTDFEIFDFTLNSVEQAYVKVNGSVVSNYSLVNKLLNGKTVLTVRFATPPNSGDFIQIHLYNLALGTRAYSEWYEQTFYITTPSYPGTYNFTLQNPEIYVQPYSAYPIVRLNGSDLKPPQQTYIVADGVSSSYSMSSDWVENISIITNSEIIVTVNNVVQVQGIDYTIYHDPTNTVMPVINFTAVPTTNSLIVISDSSQSDFKIYDGVNLWINQKVNILSNSILTVLTQGNHDVNQQYTHLYSGSTQSLSIIDLGLDGLGIDTTGFDFNTSNVIGQAYYNLPISVTNINQLYVTLTQPGATGGKILLPYQDYKLVTPTIITLDPNLNVTASSLVTVRIFGSPIRERTIEFRIFKDMRDVVRYYAVKSTIPVLTRDLNKSDAYIYVDDVNLIQNSSLRENDFGVVLINGERIAFGFIDYANNRLGNIRRGIAGTGIPQTHQLGTRVIDSGSSLEIPNTRETLTKIGYATYITNGKTNTLLPANSYVRQGQLLTNIGESIFTSNTNYAQFIRSQK